MVTPTWLSRRLTMPCDVYLRTPAAEADEYGNVVYDSTLWGSTSCFLQPYTQSEDDLGRAEFGIYLLTLSAELAGVVNAFSAFDVGGVLYEAMEAASSPHSLVRSGPHHVEVIVRRSTA